MLDVAIRGGLVVNPEGAVHADVGIEDGRVVSVGDATGVAARLDLDATGLNVMPGFVDAHSHLDMALWDEPVHLPTLHQGVTTVVLGQDGTSVAPGSAATIAGMRRYFSAVNGRHPNVPADWGSVAEYLDRVDGASTLNVAYLVPNGNLRLDTIGWDAGPATGEQLGVMSAALAAGLEQGAVGLSSGLDYVPSMCANTSELAHLCEVVRAAGGVYVTHMRGYDERSPVGFAEVAEIGRRSGVKLHISHLMGRAERHLPVVDRLVADGLDLSFDSYPYLAGCTTLAMLGLPAELQQHGPEQTLTALADADTRAALRREWFPGMSRNIGAFRLTYVAARGLEHLEGASVFEACDTLGLDLADLVCTLLLESDLAIGAIEPNGLSDDDLRATHRHRLHMAGSDGIYVGSNPHPRGWGTFARYLGRYARDREDFSWCEAVRHLSTAAAERFGLSDRGRVAVGQFADVLVLDPVAIIDTATFQHPRSPAVGVQHVLVNGVAALIDGRPTGNRPGRALRRDG